MFGNWTQRCWSTCLVLYLLSVIVMQNSADMVVGEIVMYGKILYCRRTVLEVGVFIGAMFVIGMITKMSKFVWGELAFSGVIGMIMTNIIPGVQDFNLLQKGTLVLFGFLMVVYFVMRFLEEIHKQVQEIRELMKEDMNE